MTHKVPWLTLLPGGRSSARPAPPLARPCLHQDLLIDVEDRWVECQTCGVELDPYEALARYAEEETRLTELRRRISMDLAQGVLACARCGAVPPGGRV